MLSVILVSFCVTLVCVCVTLVYFCVTLVYFCVTLVYFCVTLVSRVLLLVCIHINIVHYITHTASLPLHQISGRGSICDPLGDYNVWTMPQGIASNLSDKRITLVATKVSGCGNDTLYGGLFVEGESILNVYEISVMMSSVCHMMSHDHSWTLQHSSGTYHLGLIMTVQP